MLKNMQPKNKIYIILITFSLISLALIAFLIYPTFLDIKNNANQILSYKDESVIIEMENKELGDFKKEYKEYGPNFKKIDQLFIDSKDPIDFIKFLEKISSDSGVTADINLADADKNAKDDDLPISKFQVYVKGDFLHVLGFSEKLETGPYLIKVLNLTMEKVVQSSIKEKNVPDTVDASLLIGVANK